MQRYKICPTRKDYDAIIFAILQTANKMNLPRKLCLRYKNDFYVLLADPQ